MMKLKKIKINNCERYTLCVWKDNLWIAFQAVLDAVQSDKTKERIMLEKVSDDLVGFLKDRDILQPKMEELITLAQANKAQLTLDGKEVMPFRPLLYRDFMLGEKHIINSSRGFAKQMMPKVMPLVNIYEWLTHKPFPTFEKAVV